MEKEEIILCACHSFEHQAIFYIEQDTPKITELYVYFHLQKRNKFLTRLKYGIKYIFGYNSCFGAWDEFIFDDKNLHQLKEYLNKLN